MHQPIKDRLEECLEGIRDPEVEAHLSSCASCRETVDAMRTQAALFRSLKAPAPIMPPPGFYSRVMARIETQQPSSLWDILLDPIFGRRLVYASLTLVLAMTTYLMVSQPPRELAASPEAIIATPSDENPAAIGANPQRDRDSILVTLTTFEE